MPIDITIEVEYYRPAYLGGASTVLLQSPVAPERLPSDETLIRQDQGQYKNEVSFEPSAHVKKVSCDSHRTYAHGVLTQSHLDRGYRKGDRIWLTEAASEDRDEYIKDKRDIAAVNLRTWQPITVALDDVCWIPKFRKIDSGEDEEELLTISGPPVRKHDRKIYLLAIAQRLRLRNGTTSVERVEVREIVEQDSFKYNNLTALPDGKQKTAELFHRSLAAVAPTFFETALQEPTATPWGMGMPHTGSAPGHAISLATPPPEEELLGDVSLNFGIGLPLTEDEDNPDVKRKMQELQRVVKAKKAQKRKPLIPAGPVGRTRFSSHKKRYMYTYKESHDGTGMLTNTTEPQPPADICNLGQRCPTPHRVFFQANRPSLENLYPRHHHRPDHECPIGAAHSVHCVFRFLPGRRDVLDRRLCIIPATVKHHCCETNARPVNKTFRRRPDMIDGGRGSIQVTGGRGTISMVAAEGRQDVEDCGVPVEVSPMPFVAARDLDELGRQLYGHEGGGVGLAEGGWALLDKGGSPDDQGDDEAGECQLHAVPEFSREHQQIHEGRPCLSAAPGSTASRPIVLEEEDGDEELDVFGDRHFYGGDDDYDEDMGLGND
ncbi:hypothetical protein diail_5203 [Diaporthe ilicicola]|nr:hypothetical protein diail_5203 [Diaporthe ilicicola]